MAQQKDKIIDVEENKAQRASVQVEAMSNDQSQQTCSLPQPTEFAINQTYQDVYFPSYLDHSRRLGDVLTNLSYDTTQEQFMYLSTLLDSGVFRYSDRAVSRIQQLTSGHWIEGAKAIRKSLEEKVSLHLHSAIVILIHCHDLCHSHGYGHGHGHGHDNFIR
jgi:hypothetical protein